jgi:hypothetical protein
MFKLIPEVVGFVGHIYRLLRKAADPQRDGALSIGADAIMARES